MNKDLVLSEVEQKFFDLCRAPIEGLGLKIYDLEYVSAQKTLRIFITQVGEVTAQLEDCVKVDRELGPVFESQEWIPEGIVLEVSSPGLYRRLRSQDHFSMAVGKEIRLILEAETFDSLWAQSYPEDVCPSSLKGQKQTRALLKEVNNTGVVLDIETHALVIPYQGIKKAKLDPAIL